MFLKVLILITIQLFYAINASNGRLFSEERALKENILNDIPTSPPPPELIPVATPCTGDGFPTNYYGKWITYNKIICYYFPTYQYTYTWHDSREKCLQMNATLVSIPNPTVNALLSHRPYNSIPYYSKGVFWSGLNSLAKKGVYRWSDGSVVTYFPFSSYTSAGDRVNPDINFQDRCVSFKSLLPGKTAPDLGHWYKDSCYNRFPYICEKYIIPPTPIPPTPTPPGNCPKGWYVYANEKCINYVDHQNGTFNQSQATCKKLGGDMLSIHSQEENDFVTTITAGKTEPYIGLYTKDSYEYSYMWDDSSKKDYTNFGKLNSYNDDNYDYNCVVMITNTSQPGYWDEVNCSDTRPVLCEMNKDESIKDNNAITLAPKCTIPGFNNFYQHGNSCYLLIDSNKTFTDAESSCLGKGDAHLVSILGPFEQIFINYYIKQFGQASLYWIGYRSQAQSDTNMTQLFEWVDDWPSYYSNWDTNEPLYPDLPQEECVAMNKKNGTWRTIPCDSNLGYICKTTLNKKPDIESDRTGVCPILAHNSDKRMNWVNVDQRSQHCYWFSVAKGTSYYSTGILSWDDASFQCKRRNGTLASVHSKHELMLLDNYFMKVKQSKGYYSTYYNYWLGLSKSPAGEFVWSDDSPLDYTYWAPGQRFTNSSGDFNSDDTDNRCVESKITDAMWRQVICAGNKRNYYVCQIPKIYSSSDDKKSNAGKTAGIVIGVLLVIGALVALGIFVSRRMKLTVTQMPSFENPLSRNGNGIKSQTTESNHNNLTNNSNENPFVENR